MATRRGKYWHAALRDSRGMTVDGESFDGVSVDTDARRVWLYIAGLATAQGDAFVMPADPYLLRDLAQALKKTADDIEANWRKRSPPPGPLAPPPSWPEDLYAK